MRQPLRHRVRHRRLLRRRVRWLLLRPVRQLLRPVQRLLADQRPSACGKSGSTPTSGLHVKGMRGCVRRPTMKTKWLVRPRLKKEEKMDTGDAAKKEELEGETKNEDAMN
jgi:hypothetical protein